MAETRTGTGRRGTDPGRPERPGSARALADPGAESGESGETGGARPARRPPDRWKLIFVTLLVVGVLGAASWVALGSKLLVVRHIEVSGTHLLPRDRVAAAARVRLGLPMAQLDTAAAADRVAAIREVESARVERRWPGTVRIVVRERVPLVAVERAGRYYQLDRFGVTVAESAARPALPLLLAAAPGPADPATAAALTVLRQLPERLADRIAAIQAGSPEAITLRLRASGGELTVVWGAAERTADKVRLLETLRRTPAGLDARTIDVSSPEVVTTA